MLLCYDGDFFNNRLINSINRKYLLTNCKCFTFAVVVWKRITLNTQGGVKKCWYASPKLLPVINGVKNIGEQITRSKWWKACTVYIEHKLFTVDRVSMGEAIDTVFTVYTYSVQCWSVM